MARIGVDELRSFLEEGKSPIVLDVRAAGARRRDPRRIPGAIVFDVEEIDQRVAELPRDREIILYCT
jgi:rhodanese-related sulfurtransferase